MALSYYGTNFSGSRQNISFFHQYAGGKWIGIYDFFQSNPDVLEKYDYIWFPDDDIQTNETEINKMFALVHQHELELAQPALSLSSFYSHKITLKNKNFILRYTNFVELMVPVIHTRLLKNILIMFKGTHSGRAIDWKWQDFTSDPSKNVAILDAVVVDHNRPLNQHLRGKMKTAGISPNEERAYTMGQFAIRPTLPLAHAGITTDGQFISSGTKMAKLVTSGYFTSRHDVKFQPWKPRHFILFYITHFFQRTVKFFNQ